MKKIKRGFTLIELIVVIAIIAILAAIALPRLSKYLSDAELTKTEANAKNVYIAAAAFDTTNDVTEVNGIYPFTTTDIQPYLDSNAEIVDGTTNTVNAPNKASVKVYRVGASVPKTTYGANSDITETSKTATVDTYVVTVYNGSTAVTYGY